MYSGGGGGNMYGNNPNMYANMMGQQANPMMGGQMAGQMGGPMGTQTGQQMGQMPGQMPGQIPQMAGSQSQQQTAMTGMPQQSTGNAMMTSMPGMAGMAGMTSMGMPGMAAGNMAGQTASTPAAGATGMQGMMGQQGMTPGMMVQPGANAGMMGQQGMNAGMMGQQGMNPAMANWQTMAAQNPQALAAMQAYMQQYAMRMAYSRMAAGMGGMTATGGMIPMAGHMGAMGGAMGGMGMMPGMGMGTGTMGQQQGRMGQQQGGNEGAEGSRFYKTRVCNKWKDGNCPYGDTCKYAHGDADLRQPIMGAGGTVGNRMAAARPEADKRTMFELMRKTRICDEFMKTGSCKYGDKCTFAHGQQELRQAPPNLKEALGQTQQGSVVKDGMHKTRLCERFMNTKTCPYGDKCTFAHGHHELRQRLAGGAAPSGGKTLPQNPAGQQQKPPVQQQPQPQQQKKREREDDNTAEGDKAGEEGAKRQHMEGEGAGNGDQQDQHEPGHDAAGGSGVWDWAGDGEGDGEGKAWGEGGASEQQPHEEQTQEGQDQQQQDDVGAGEAGGDESGGDDGPAAGNGSGAGGAAAKDAGEAAGAADSSGESGCRLCTRMVKTGRDKMLAAVQQLSAPGAQKLGAMILGYGTPRFDQLWHKLSFSQLQSMLSKSELPLADRIELLKAVCFHTHCSEEERQRLDSQKYVSQGLPPDVADFVAMALDGKEGSAQMTEYFAALEVCKSLYGITEEEFFNVSSTMANLFMNM